jgi:hypothetical protein
MDIEQFKRDLKAAGTSFLKVKNRSIIKGDNLLRIIDLQTSSSALLCGLFTWKGTKEGLNYWNTIRNNLLTIEENRSVPTSN